jgi:hypothetical protein
MVLAVPIDLQCCGSTEGLACLSDWGCKSAANALNSFIGTPDGFIPVQPEMGNNQEEQFQDLQQNKSTSGHHPQASAAPSIGGAQQVEGLAKMHSKVPGRQGGPLRSLAPPGIERTTEEHLQDAQRSTSSLTLLRAPNAGEPKAVAPLQHKSASLTALHSAIAANKIAKALVVQHTLKHSRGNKVADEKASPPVKCAHCQLRTCNCVFYHCFFACKYADLCMIIVKSCSSCVMCFTLITSLV